MRIRKSGTEDISQRSVRLHQMGLAASLERVGFLILALLFLAVFSGACDSSKNRVAPSQKEGAPAAPVAQKQSPVTRPDVGFGSREKLVEHYQKHGREFGVVTMEEYLRRAQVLRDRPAGGDMLETVRPDGVVKRPNTSLNTDVQSVR